MEESNKSPQAGMDAPDSEGTIPAQLGPKFRPILIVHDNPLVTREGEEYSRSLFNSLVEHANFPFEVIETFVFDQTLPNNSYESLLGPKTTALPGYPHVLNNRYIRAEFAPELKALDEKIQSLNPQLILCMGNLALWAVCKKSGIKQWRGTVLLDKTKTYNVMPTWGLGNLARNYPERPIAYMDFAKAGRTSHSPDFSRISRKIWLDPTLEDLAEFYQLHLQDSPFVSCDVETSTKTITEVGFGDASGRNAIVIPFYSHSRPNNNYWPTTRDELQAWKFVAKVLAEKPVIGQNFAYDMSYFWRTMGIPTLNFEGDTMLMHHALQIEMQKSLGFLASIYSNEPAWKFMRTQSASLKKEAE